jgi:hypothetical protein
MALELEADAAVVPLAHERRRHKRDDLCFKVRFCVLHEDDALDDSYMDNVSFGGLGLCGSTDTLRGRSIKEGDFLKIEIQPPRTEASVRCLGRVTWVEFSLDSDIFRAGVSFVAVNPEDLEKIREAFS